MTGPVAEETRYLWLEHAALEESAARWIGVRDGELTALRFSVASRTVSDVRKGTDTPAEVERLFGLLREHGIETFESEYVGDPETSLEEDRLRLVAQTERGRHSVFAFATLAPKALQALVDELMTTARTWRALHGAPRFLRCAEIPRARAEAWRVAGRPSIQFEDRRSVRPASITKALERPGWFVPISPDQLDHESLGERQQLVVEVGNETFIVSIYEGEK